MISLGATAADSGDVGAAAREYTALRRGAVVFDRGDRGRTVLSGDQAAQTLTGLVTNDVLALKPGSGQYAAALTAKGKIITDLRIFARGDHLFVDVPPRAAGGWMAMLRKYVNPRVTRYTEVSQKYGTLGIYGVRARELAATACARDARDLTALDMYGHLPCGDATDAFVARVPDLGLEGYDVIVPAEELPAWRDRFLALGATAGSAGSWTTARIEAGRPEWGLDMDETTLAQEANLEALNALSFTKGCYTGQETVARIHFRGHINRYLRGLRFGLAVPSGARLVDSQGREVGDVRSVALSPRLGGVALGMVRREVVGEDALQATWEGGSTTVVVQELPFPL